METERENFVARDKSIARTVHHLGDSEKNTEASFREWVDKTVIEGRECSMLKEDLVKHPP